MPDILDKSLNARFRQHLGGELLRFHVEEKGRTSGYFRLQLTDQATDDEKREARAMGYSESESDFLYFTFYMKDTRYLASKNEMRLLSQLSLRPELDF